MTRIVKLIERELPESESQTIETPVRASTLDDYTKILGNTEINEIRTMAERLGRRSVQMVNSTAVGGGVAEMLNRMVPLMHELGDLDVRWDVMTGGDDFFAITKAFHNALHGGGFWTCRTRASRPSSPTPSRTAHACSSALSSPSCTIRSPWR